MSDFNCVATYTSAHKHMHCFPYHNELRSMHCKKMCYFNLLKLPQLKECPTVTIVIIAMSSSALNNASLLQQSLTVVVIASYIIYIPS